MKGILIKPIGREVTEVETTGELVDIYRLCECEIVQTIPYPCVPGHDAYLDEERLLREPMPYQWWAFAGLGAIIGSPGLILSSTRAGNSASVKTTAEDVRKNILWIETLMASSTGGVIMGVSREGQVDQLVNSNSIEAFVATQIPA